MSLEVLKLILAETFSQIDSANTILPEHRLERDLELDSVDMVNLWVAIEDKLDMRLNPYSVDLVEVFDTVGSLAAFLDLCLEEPSQDVPEQEHNRPRDRTGD